MANRRALELVDAVGELANRLESLLKDVAGDSAKNVVEQARRIKELAKSVADVPTTFRFRLEMQNHRYVGEGQLPNVTTPPNTIYWGTRRFDRDGAFDEDSYQYVFLESHSTTQPESSVRVEISDIKRLASPAWKGRE